MDGDGLTLTSYLAERHRSGGQFTADALLALYQEHEIASSLLLRGIQGFGLNHQLRTDQSLTWSADLPVTAVAVDAAARIETVAAQVMALASPALVTLERAWRLDGGSAPAPGPPGRDGGQAKLTVVLSRQDQAYQIPAFEALCDLLYRRCVAGATALQGVDGTRAGRRQRPRGRFLGRADLPMMVVAVGDHELIRSIIPDVSELLRHPLLTVQPVRVCKRDGLLLGVPDRTAGTGEHGLPRWQKLTVYASESAQHAGQPMHRVLLQRLLSAGVHGVTTVRGVWGFHGDHAPHGESGLHLTRHAPAVTTVIDAPERIPAAFAIIDELTAERGLVTSETVTASQAVGELREGRP